MARKKLTERGLGQAKLTTLIEYYLADMQRRGCTQDSMATNRRSLKRFGRWAGKNFSATKLVDIEEDVTEGYATSLQTRKVRWKNHPLKPTEPGKLSPFTIRKEIRILKGFGTWLEREGFDNPFDALVVPKEPKRLVKILTDDEIERILRSINPNTPIGSRLFAIVLFLLDSGPRASEVCSARIPDLDLDTRQVRIVGKGNKERIIPFGTRTGKAFLSYLHVHRPKPMSAEYDQLFLSMDGFPLTRSALCSIMHRLKKSSGVERVHAHLFRHTFAVNYLLNGGDVMTLQRILGHESLEVTKRYLSLTSAQVQLRYDAHSPVDRMQVSGLRRFGNKRSTN